MHVFRLKVNLTIEAEYSPISKQPILKRIVQFEDLQTMSQFRNDSWILSIIKFLELPFELKP